ncbi:MAG: hypothetical protein V3V18_02915 [Methylococcales bacterium]
MRYRAMSLLLVLSLSGCAMSAQMDSIRKIADKKEFHGLDRKTQFSISFPSSHSGPFKSVDQLNFIIEEGKYKGKNASALLVKYRKTETWDVLTIMVEDNDRWVNIPKSNLNKKENSNNII